MPLKDKIESVRTQFLADIDSCSNNPDGINTFRIKYIGRKGLVAELFQRIGDYPPGDRPAIGQALNDLKLEISTELDAIVQSLDQKRTSIFNYGIDISLPEKEAPIGSVHILEQTLNEIKNIFISIGFHVAYGPEVDDDYHNFGALNFPEHHPARDMQDTFFVDNDTVLRTHTSNVQIHLMEKKDPPLRYIVPGRVYRNEAISFKSYCLFHQVEGLFVDKNVSFGQLKGCLEYFVKQMFGSNRKMRWRPSYFPFTEPSAEVDIWDEERQQWMEILGCGMVDPAVFDNVGYDSHVWHGYAFGMGVERITMLKHKINDIRLFYNGDVRFLEQFS